MTKFSEIWVNGTHNSLTTKLFLGPLQQASGHKRFLWSTCTNIRQYGEVVRIFSTFRQFHQRPQEETGRLEHIVIIFGFLMSSYVCRNEKWVEILNLHTFSQDTTAQFFIQMRGSLTFPQNFFLDSGASNLPKTDAQNA